MDLLQELTGGASIGCRRRRSSAPARLRIGIGVGMGVEVGISNADCREEECRVDGGLGAGSD